MQIMYTSEALEQAVSESRQIVKGTAHTGMEDIHTCKSYRDNSSCFWRRSFAEEEEEAEKR